MPSIQSYSLFTDFDIHLFKAGNHYKLYEKLGSHPVEIDGEKGYYFAVWAPNARRVSVIGNFNEWQRNEHALNIRLDDSGIWEGFIPGIEQGELYKYAIDAADGRALAKGDPFAQLWEVPPNTSSITWNPTHKWKDKKWLNKRKKRNAQEQPYSVYEVHLGSWKKKKGTNNSLTYKELTNELVAYVADMGFTHVEFLPVMEHPYFPSWGYQITGYFAPSSRFGLPEDFMYLVDQFHQNDIGIILDWVPSHFPTDAHGLADFDGTHLYDHADPRQGFHPDWKSSIFNYGRNEVRSFLISNALFWLDRYHIDGYRVDAIASILHLDYSREEGQWIPNKYGGNENLEAIDFLKEFNSIVFQEFPDVVTIAEDSTSWPKVSRPVFDGGLGFSQKWMMGWMNDTLEYFKSDPLFRKGNHSSLTFSIMYAYSENFMLPLSHDEVVHGKASLINKMPGNEWQKFANLRLLYGYMFTHPGSQLLFMGGEFGQTTEWSIETGLIWDLLQYDYHKGIQTWVKDLNKIVRTKKALFECQFEPQGFEWINHSDHLKSMISYTRKGKEAKDCLVVVCNFTPVEYPDFRVGVPQEGKYKEILNSDAKKYGGKDVCLNKRILKSEEKHWDDREHSIGLKVPGLGVVVLEWQK